jgi:hypothetical protein
MGTDPLPGVDVGHAHGVDLEATFDFLNTLDLETGFPLERLPSLDDALTWFVARGVIHGEGADRARARVATQPEAADRDLDRVHAVRDALREVAEAITGDTSRSAHSVDLLEHRTVELATLAKRQRRHEHLKPERDGRLSI